MNRIVIVIAFLLALLLLALPFGLTVGGVDISLNAIREAVTGDADAITHYIIIENRFPALLTALLAGASLSVAGLLMQTCFGNPLAGPSIMGISSGASLGVALVIMFLGGAVGVRGNIAVFAGALFGAFAVLGILSLFSLIVKSGDALLIVGILIGYLAGSIISLLNFFSTDQAVHSFVLWGLGTFSTVGLERLPYFVVISVILLLSTAFYARSLNALLLGDRFAANVGLSVRRVRTGLMIISGALTAVVSAWCGPIGFIGLVVPHIARLLLGSSNHTRLLPVTALCGALMGVLCQIVSVAPSLSNGGVLPVNAITPLIGVPVIVYVLINRRKLLYFN